MASDTFNIETELSAVNSILGAIGQAPSNSLDTANPEVALALKYLRDISSNVQAEGWIFNTEYEYPFPPSSNNEIVIPLNVMRLDLSASERCSGEDVIRRDGKLYDRLNHSFTFTRTVMCDVIWKLSFSDLPQAFQQYVIYRAARMASVSMIGNPEIYKLLEEQERQTRSVCCEYECSQGDYNMLNGPYGTSPINTYRPVFTVAR